MRKKSIKTILILLGLSLAVVCILAFCIVTSYLTYGQFNWKDILYKIVEVSCITIIVTTPLGILAKIITERWFSVNINMLELRKNGISSIGSGISDQTDINKMFGTKRLTKNYPYKLKLFFLTGNKFLYLFQKQITKCMDEGCEVQLLIADPDDDNRNFLERNAALLTNKENPGSVDYVNELKTETFSHIKSIRNNSVHPENLKVRFYRDEYINNVRIAKYIDGKGEISHYWINLQPLSNCAINLSVALKGTVTFDSKTNKDTNMCLASEAGFEKLWDIYQNTENKYTF